VEQEEEDEKKRRNDIQVRKKKSRTGFLSKRMFVTWLKCNMNMFNITVIVVVDRTE
jgi:hypothetical protein